MNLGVDIAKITTASVNKHLQLTGGNIMALKDAWNGLHLYLMQPA